MKWFEIPQEKVDVDVATFNLYKYFKTPESKDLLPEICTFSQPADYEQRINYLKIELDGLSKFKQDN